MFQDQNLVAKFHRITRLNLRESMQGVMTETSDVAVTGLVAIPSVIFFPDLNNADFAQFVAKHQESVPNTKLFIQICTLC